MQFDHSSVSRIDLYEQDAQFVSKVFWLISYVPYFTGSTACHSSPGSLPDIAIQLYPILVNSSTVRTWGCLLSSIRPLTCRTQCISPHSSSQMASWLTIPSCLHKCLHARANSSQSPFNMPRLVTCSGIDQCSMRPCTVLSVWYTNVSNTFLCILLSLAINVFIPLFSLLTSDNNNRSI